MSGSEAELTLVMKAKNLASREVDRLHGSLTKVKTAAGGLGHALGTLAKVGILGVAGAAVGLVGFLGLATKAAADEQKGIVRLDAALRANVKGYKGNTDSIEALIKKREGLAFSDDDLRASLSVLVAKYHDVNRAQQIQGVAMDVARLKGISLADATALVSKGMDGSAKVLKQLGIVLPKTATEQERLTAIQKKAAGQAEAYGKTAAGAQEAFGIALGDVVENIGAHLIPIMTQAFTFLRTNVLPAIDNVITAVGGWIHANQPLINQVRAVLLGALQAVIGKIVGIVGWIASLVSAIANKKTAMNILKTIAAGIASAFALAWGAIESLVSWIGNVVDSISKNKTAMKVLGAIFDGIASAVGGVISAIQTLIGWVQQAIDLLTHLDTLTASTTPGLVPTLKSPKGHAAGGWVGLHGPELSWVGERGPEYIVPNHQLGNGAGGGGFTIKGVSERQIIEMVDRGLYFKLQRATPTLGRT